MPFDDAWIGLVDDAAAFPPGDLPLREAMAAYAERSAEEGADLVGTFVVRDTDLALVRGFRGPLSVVVTGGAGQLAGPVGLCAKLGLELAGLEVAVRDLDDPLGATRRIVTALRDLGDDVPVYVELPQTEPGHGWLAAADVVAAAELRLAFRTGNLDAAAYPSPDVLAGWIDAAQDRETPFRCTAGLHRAVRHTDDDGFEHHGFVNVLLATMVTWDGAGRQEVVDVLERRDPAVLARWYEDLEPAPARRWFTSFGSASIAEPWADLRSLGLVP